MSIGSWNKGFRALAAAALLLVACGIPTAAMAADDDSDIPVAPDWANAEGGQPGYGTNPPVPAGAKHVMPDGSPVPAGVDKGGQPGKSAASNAQPAGTDNGGQPGNPAASNAQPAEAGVAKQNSIVPTRTSVAPSSNGQSEKKSDSTQATSAESGNGSLARSNSAVVPGSDPLASANGLNSGMANKSGALAKTGSVGQEAFSQALVALCAAVACLYLVGMLRSRD